MHVKVASLVLVQAIDLNTSETVAVLCPTGKIYPYFPVKIVNRDKIPHNLSSILLTDKIM